MAERPSDASDAARSPTRPPGEDRPGKEDDFFKPPPPEVTNMEHPAPPGERAVVPGEGIVDPDVARRASVRADDRGPDEPRHRRERAPSDLEAPGRDEPSGSAGAAAREVNDPNYTAASRAPTDRTATSPMNPNLEAPTRPTRRAHPTQARDVMSANVEVAGPDTDLYYIARMMAERDVGAIPIVDDTDTMHPLGIITDRDIVVRVIAKNQTPNELKVGEVMTPAVITVRDDAPLAECVRRMEEHRVRRILVVDEQNRVVGIVAQADIAARAPEGETADLVSKVSEPD